MATSIIFKGLSWPIQYGELENHFDLSQRLEEEGLELLEETVIINNKVFTIRCEVMDDSDNEKDIILSTEFESNVVDSKELLFFVHNSLISYLEDNDYHFLEGLRETEKGFYDVLLGN